MSSGVLEKGDQSGLRVIRHLGDVVYGLDKEQIVRTFQELSRSWSDNPEEQWWHWVSETVEMLGVKSHIIDCTPQEAADLAFQDVTLVTYQHENDNPWIVIRSNKRKIYETCFTNDEVTENRINRTLLYKILNSRTSREDQLLRLVVIENPSGDIHSRENHQTLKPFKRLLQLLKPEWPDIWLIMVFAFVAGLLMLATPIAVESLVNTVAFGRLLQPVVMLALILFLFLGFMAAVRALQTYVVEIIQRRLFTRIAGDLAFRLSRTDNNAIEGQYLPEKVNRFFDVVTVQKVSSQLLLDGIALILNAIVGMAVLAFYHPWLLGFDLILLGCIGFLIFVLGHGATKSAVKESKNKYYMAEWLEEIVRCKATFKNEGGAEFAVTRADGLINQYLTARKHHFQILMRQILFALGLQAFASTILLGLGGWLVISGELTLGQLVAAELIVAVIVGAFAKLGKHMESFYDLLAAMDKLGQLFDLPIQKQIGLIHTDNQAGMEVNLHNLTFKYSPQFPLINDLDLQVPAGSSLAISGGTGSGKSSLIDLIIGMRQPNQGYITLNGVRPADYHPDAFQKKVAYLKEAEIFKGTIAENLHFHRDSVTDSDSQEVLTAFGLHELIMEFPQGYETKLNSEGYPLSQTQTVMITLARAIVGKPSLILLDGTLDSLSDEDADRVLSYLLSETHDWTTIITTGQQRIASQCDHSVSLSSK